MQLAVLFRLAGIVDRTGGSNVTDGHTHPCKIRKGGAASSLSPLRSGRDDSFLSILPRMQQTSSFHFTN